MSAQLIWIGTLTSLVAGLGTALGSLCVFFFRTLPETLEDVLLSIAAGTMPFVISEEVIPDTHRRGLETPATLADGRVRGGDVRGRDPGLGPDAQSPKGSQARCTAGRASIASCQRLRLGYSSRPIWLTPCRWTSGYMVMSATV